MDKLVVADVKEVSMNFKRGKRCSFTFRLTNLMHSMHVAVSLTTNNTSFFTFSNPFSVLPPLSTSSFTLFYNPSGDKLPRSSFHDSVTVRSCMLPVGKAHQDDLRLLFSRIGSHIFKDATLPIFFVGPHVVEFFLSSSRTSSSISILKEMDYRFKKAISGCSDSQLTSLLKPAVEAGNGEFLKELIDSGGDVNFRNPDSESIISIAVRSGNIEIVSVLIASGCTIKNSVDHVLHDAAAKNRVDLMRLLCAEFEEIDVNLADSDGRSAIHVAAICGHVESLQFLVSIGGNVDVPDLNQWTPLHFAASEGHEQAVDFLLSTSPFMKYAVTDGGKTAFAIAVDNGHSNLYESLHLDDVLQRSATVDDVHGMKSCIAEGANINGRDQNGWTPLHRAAFKGRMESVMLLISNGAQVNLVDDAGNTPLNYAVETGHKDIALFLISHGAKESVKSLKGKSNFGINWFKNHHPSVCLPLHCEKEQS